MSARSFWSLVISLLQRCERGWCALFKINFSNYLSLTWDVLIRGQWKGGREWGGEIGAIYHRRNLTWTSNLSWTWTWYFLILGQRKHYANTAFQIAYFFFLLLVRTPTALTKYILLHAVCIQLGYITLSYYFGFCCCADLPHCTVNASICALSAVETLWSIFVCQRIVGQNNQKSMLAFILQNATGCSRISWYFWHTAFDILCIGTY